MHRLILVPSCLGAPFPGTHKGPRRIMRALEKQFSKVPFRKEIPIIDSKPERSNRSHQRAKNLFEVREVCKKLAKEVARSIRYGGEIPIVLHGDDSSVIGTGYGFSTASEEPFGIVYFDAHGDMNTPESTLSSCLYGMGLAHLLGFGYPELLALNTSQPAVKAENVVLVGTRNLDPGEQQLIQRERITVYAPQNIQRRLNQMLREIERKFRRNNIRQLYLHFDQDVVDPTESCGTLTPEPGGISRAELYEIVSFLKERFEIVAGSFGNYLPTRDREEKTLRIILTLLSILGTTGEIRDYCEWSRREDSTTSLTEIQRTQIAAQLAKHHPGRTVVNIPLGPEIVLKEFVIHPHVYRSDIMDAGFQLAKYLVAHPELYSGKVVLDMGCGPGIQGIVMALGGAQHVYLSDISFYAVANAQENVKKFGIEDKVTVVQGDLFEKITDEMDVIVFNHPFFPGEPERVAAQPVAGSMLAPPLLFPSFLSEAPMYLTSGGIIITSYYHLAGLSNNPARCGSQLGYRVVEKARIETQVLQKGEISIYELSC